MRHLDEDFPRVRGHRLTAVENSGDPQGDEAYRDKPGHHPDHDQDQLGQRRSPHPEHFEGVGKPAEGEGQTGGKCQIDDEGGGQGEGLAVGGGEGRIESRQGAYREDHQEHARHGHGDHRHHVQQAKCPARGASLVAIIFVRRGVTDRRIW